MVKAYILNSKGARIEIDLSVFTLIELERVLQQDALSFIFDFLNEQLDIKGNESDEDLFEKLEEKVSDRKTTALILETLSNGEFKFDEIKQMDSVDYLILVKTLQYLIGVSFTGLVKKNEEYKSDNLADEEMEFPFVTTKLQDLIVKGLKAGLTIEDSKELTLGAWTDLVLAYSNLNSSPSKGRPKTREATQEDINRFFGGVKWQVEN